MREILWRPSEERIHASEMMSFMKQLEKRRGLTFSGYRELHQWSIDHPEVSGMSCGFSSISSRRAIMTPSSTI